MARALVVFQKEGEHLLSWLLHPEFRHCFCAIDDGLYWVLMDARDGLPLVKVAAASEHDLAGFYRSRGHIVVETQCGPGIRGPFCVANCVGVVKSALGLRSWAVTPFQLHRYLVKR